MHKTKLLIATFEQELEPWEIIAFRGAIASKVGKDESLFHNHIDDKFVYSYPLIQYKIIQKKAGIIGIASGAENIYKIFEKGSSEISIGEKSFPLTLDQMNLKTVTLQVWDTLFNYRIKNWIGLKSENFKKYQELEGLAEKTQFLEKVLTGNIITMAKGLDWTIDKPIEVKITDLKSQKMIKYKNMAHLAMDLEFKCNVSLPDYIGLGKGPSQGFGVVTKNTNK